jgi:hypothetical protein
LKPDPDENGSLHAALQIVPGDAGLGQLSAAFVESFQYATVLGVAVWKSSTGAAPHFISVKQQQRSKAQDELHENLCASKLQLGSRNFATCVPCVTRLACACTSQSAHKQMQRCCKASPLCCPV